MEEEISMGNTYVRSDCQENNVRRLEIAASDQDLRSLVFFSVPSNPFLFTRKECPPYAPQVSATYPPYTASNANPCHRRNRAVTMAGITAMAPTSRQAGMSIRADAVDTGSA